MAFDIPAPEPLTKVIREGLESGSSLFSKMMQPVLDREHQAVQREQLAQQWKQHLDEIALKRQALEMQRAANAVRQKIMMQQLINAQHQNDPSYQIQQIQAFMNAFGGGQPEVTQQEAPKVGEGAGMFMPGAQISTPSPASSNALNMEAFRTNPMLRGFFKHKFGFDPGAMAGSDLMKPTQRTLSLHQNVVASADNVIPQIEALIKTEVPQQFGKATSFISPNKQAAYMGKANSIADSLMSSFGWPRTNEALEMAKQLVMRRPLESQSAYHDRLQELIKEIKARRQNSAQIIQNAQVGVNASDSAESDNVGTAQDILDYDQESGDFF